MATAFAVGIDFDPRAVEMLRSRLPDQELNEARMRMARIPVGADLIANSVSKAPGFRIENVFVMAGVPAIMHVMLDAVAPALTRGAPMLSEAIRADCREGDVAVALAEIQRAHPNTSIGSYPFEDERGYNTSLVVRSRDPAALAAAAAAVRAMLAHSRG
jgi:molybdopterin-biosynthesis enzyme MoeA-like protein